MCRMCRNHKSQCKKKKKGETSIASNVSKVQNSYECGVFFGYSKISAETERERAARKEEVIEVGN